MSLPTRIEARVRSLLAQPQAPLLLALLALVLTLPALAGGLAADDYFHRNILLHRGEWASVSPMRDLFAFVPSPRPEWMRGLGIPPWWSDPALHIHFARPLTALTHMLDYALWPDSPALQHLQSLLWYALCVGLAASVYRKVSTATAGLAGLLFAIADSHSLAATWLSGRNGLLCLAAGLGTLHLHLAWCRSRAPRHLVLALVLFALGLGCGEAAVAGAAYVAAWQLTCTEGTWSRRLLPMVPYAILVVAWRLLYNHLGYGTFGSSLYIDPGQQPFQFLQAMAERLPLLAAAQWLKTPVDLWMFLPRPTQVAATAGSALLVTGLLGLFRELLKRDPLARFWGLGMVFSLVPICAAFPMDRLLLFASLGAFGLLALFIQSCRLWPYEKVPAPGWTRRAAWVLLLLHGPLAALLLVARSSALPVIGRISSLGARQAPKGPEVVNQTFVFVNGNDFLVAYIPLIRTATGEAPPPRRITQLASLASAHSVHRADTRTLVMTAPKGFLIHAFDRLLANPARRFFIGERIELIDFTAEIRACTEDGRPLEVAFRFHLPLEDPSLRWLYWKDGKLVAFPLPAIGDRVAVETGGL